MNHAAEAKQKFLNGSACSQAVFSVFAERLGLSEELAHALATGLGAGFGRKQYTCGALSAGVLAIGGFFGNRTPENREAKESAFAKTRELVDLFEKEFGASDCRTLVGYDISTPDGARSAVEANIFKTVCPRCVEFVAQRIEEFVSASPGTPRT